MRPSVDGNVCLISIKDEVTSYMVWGGKNKKQKKKRKQNNEKSKNFLRARSDAGGSEAADEGDAAEAHPPEEDGAGRLHDEVLQENSQLREQGAVQKQND